jgi:hypothetical protein
MKLQNVITVLPIRNPLLYICDGCGAQLTIPPPALDFVDASPLPNHSAAKGNPWGTINSVSVARSVARIKPQSR